MAGMAGMITGGEGGISGGDAGPSQASGSNVAIGATSFGNYYAPGTGPASSNQTMLIVAGVVALGMLWVLAKK